MRVSVIVPWRGGCLHREAAWRWVGDQYGRLHVGWEVVAGECPPGPWSKALAVRDALTRATGEILVLSDADVWCDGVAGAVNSLTPGGWVVPHKQVFRLDDYATRLVLRGEPFSSVRHCTTEKPYLGVHGGGIVVIHREDYERAPLDPRFLGWGQEDEAHGYALRTTLGRATRLQFPLYHLWHPPAPRKSRRIGSDDGERLLYRYVAARRPEAMARLLEEAKACQ